MSVPKLTSRSKKNRKAKAKPTTPPPEVAARPPEPPRHEHDCIKKDDIWAAVQDGLEHVAEVLLPKYQEMNSPEDLYWAILRQAAVVRLLWSVNEPAIAAAAGVK